MIIYENSFFGFRNLSRVHGSPVYKVIFPTLFSTGFLLLINWIRDDVDTKLVQHPYAIGAFVGFFSFILTFRLNFAYSRYWEGATSVFNMISKWVDVAILMAAFHYQSKSFDEVRPPAFGSHPTLLAADLQRRVQRNQVSMEETMELVHNLEQQEHEQQRSSKSLFGIHRRNNIQSTQQSENSNRSHMDTITKTKVVAKNIGKCSGQNITNNESSRIPIPMRFQERFQQAAHEAEPTTIMLAATKKAPSILQSHHVEMPPPSLFFQELAHLVSLLTAVAMSTLRNDIEGCPPSLVEYIPGQPWPEVNPDDEDEAKQHEYGGDNKFWRALYFIFGLSRSKRHRTLYNAARPFSVLGGVSDDEMFKLERARGPYAKTALCFMWLQEFLSRESLHGSVGEIHSSLVSRCFQYSSDACIGYNQARKVAYIPFPFPHGQMTAIFSFLIMLIFPVLYQSYVVKLWFSCFMNTLTVLCFLGLHEVARELENPFTNMPNDLPLTTFQAQINEALVTMYAGYHPDAWWTVVTPNGNKTAGIAAK